MITSPLEQFEIISIIPILKSSTFFFAITNSTLYIIIILTLIILFLQFLNCNINLIPTAWQSIFEEIFIFIKGIINQNLGKKGITLFPFILFLFLFLLISNLIGMIPYSFTITSHIFVTFGLALTLFIGINIIAFKIHKLQFFGFFLPSGAPIQLAPFFMLIELMSYIARVFSLSIRLFANMMSGHTLLKIIAGFAWTMLSLGGIWTILSIFPITIIIAVTILELGIALLQAYVFTVLICLYLNDAIYLSH